MHYNDVIMSAMASEITSLTIFYSTVYSGTDQRKYSKWILEACLNDLVCQFDIVVNSFTRLCICTSHRHGVSSLVLYGDKVSELKFKWRPAFDKVLRVYRMMTSSNGNIFRVPGEFPAQRPVTRSFDVFFDLRLNKRLSKQSWSWWFETLSHPLWRHCNGLFSHRQRNNYESVSYLIHVLTPCLFSFVFVSAATLPVECFLEPLFTKWEIMGYRNFRSREIWLFVAVNITILHLCITAAVDLPADTTERYKDLIIGTLSLETLWNFIIWRLDLQRARFGDHFTEELCNAFHFSSDNPLSCTFMVDHHITTQCCTYHENRAVVSCVKLWSDKLFRSSVRAKWDYDRICIAPEKSTEK